MKMDISATFSRYLKQGEKTWPIHYCSIHIRESELGESWMQLNLLTSKHLAKIIIWYEFNTFTREYNVHTVNCNTGGRELSQKPVDFTQSWTRERWKTPWLLVLQWDFCGRRDYFIGSSHSASTRQKWYLTNGIRMDGLESAKSGICRIQLRSHRTVFHSPNVADPPAIQTLSPCCGGLRCCYTECWSLLGPAR